MIYSAEYIGQPYSGEYVEKIYDISSPWNSSDWSWIKFEDDNGEWSESSEVNLEELRFLKNLVAF